MNTFVSPASLRKIRRKNLASFSVNMSSLQTPAQFFNRILRNFGLTIGPQTHSWKIAYFGGQPLGTGVLDILLNKNIKPDLVVTSPDRPVGRGQKMQENELKAFAIKNDIETFQPENLKDREVLEPILETDWDLFIVVAYPKILPDWFLSLPKFGSLNLHPSLLPKYRGVSPIRSAILEDDRETGVSVMLLDKEMDHGPLLAQEKLSIPENHWPISGRQLDNMMIDTGGNLLAETVPKWLSHKIEPREQNHNLATYTKKFTREDGELDLDPFNLPEDDKAYQALLKIRAFDGWPGTFFFHKDKRIKITDASISNANTLEIHSVIPEGKQEQSFSDWLQGQ